MKAAYIQQTGPPENIVYGDLPTPRPAQNQALVKVEAVDVNPIDIYIRGGLVSAQLAMPYIIGCDLAGTVEEIGSKVARFKPGDRVWASNQGQQGRQGTFAEYAVVEERWLYPIPKGIDSNSAVAISLVGLTAALGLSSVRLAPGETIFVQGGTGGVGSMVLQMAKAIGASVITTAGSDEKLQRCRELGADLAINYRTDDVNARIRDFAPKGVDVWWETLREPDFDRAVSLMAIRGRMLLMAGRDARPAFPVGPFYVKSCSLIGFAMFNASSDEQRVAAEQINRWLSAGQLKANIDRVLPLSQAAVAHKLQEESTIQKSGAISGKIVLTL